MRALATAVEPRGRPFDDPPARSGPGPARAALLAAAADVRTVTAPPEGALGIRVVRPLVETEMLRDVPGGAHDAGIQQRADGLLVWPVRRSQGNGDGHPRAALPAGTREFRILPGVSWAARFCYA